MATRLASAAGPKKAWPVKFSTSDSVKWFAMRRGILLPTPSKSGKGIPCKMYENGFGGGGEDEPPDHDHCVGKPGNCKKHKLQELQTEK